MVEHLLAKEDVASSSLVTRSNLRLKRSRRRKAGASDVVLAKADFICASSYGWQAKVVSQIELSETRATVHSGGYENYVALPLAIRRARRHIFLFCLVDNVQDERYAAGFAQKMGPTKNEKISEK